MNNQVTYKCLNCLTTIVVNSNIKVDSCINCKNKEILLENSVNVSFPEFLLPFKYTRKFALFEFEKYIKQKKIIPSKFKKNIKRIRNIYIPFRVYDFYVNGEVEFDCKTITTWKSGKYKYEKTDSSIVTTECEMTISDIVVGDSKFVSEDIIKKILPFDYDKIEKISLDYLSDITLEKTNIETDSIKEQINIVAKNIFIDELKKQINNYNFIDVNSSSINLNVKEEKYILLPIWFLSVKYKKKVYTIVMNGQNGKITGNIPISVGKILGIFLVIFVAFTFLGLAISYFKVII